MEVWKIIAYGRVMIAVCMAEQFSVIYISAGSRRVICYAMCSPDFNSIKSGARSET